MPVTNGGTGANLSATGGTGRYLKQTSAGGAVAVGTIPASDIPSLDAAKIATGVLAIANGGTGSATQNFVALTTVQNIGGAKPFTDAVNTAQHFSIGGNRLLSNARTKNLFAGVGAGASNISNGPEGSYNAFFGSNAGFADSVGYANAFFGVNAGHETTEGGNNSFFGRNTAYTNTTGNNNSALKSRSVPNPVVLATAQEKYRNSV